MNQNLTKNKQKNYIHINDIFRRLSIRVRVIWVIGFEQIEHLIYQKNWEIFSFALREQFCYIGQFRFDKCLFERSFDFFFTYVGGHSQIAGKIINAFQGKTLYCTLTIPWTPVLWILNSFCEKIPKKIKNSYGFLLKSIP